VSKDDASSAIDGHIMTSVSVVICAYTLDRWQPLKASVQSCLNQTELPNEIVIVIDHNDELFNCAKAAFDSAIVIENISTKGLSGARNSGVAVSSGDVVTFLDDDAFAEPTWLEELTKPLVDPLVCGVGGWIVPFWEAGEATWFPETFYWVLGCSYLGLPTTDAPIRNPIGANMAIRRRVFDEVGGFTSGLGRIGAALFGSEETELCIRYSKKHPNEYFMLAHRAVVDHRVPSSRLSWHYFWTRCWAEGLSKAGVSSLVGPSSGLATERRYVFNALPREFFQSLRLVARQPRTALAKASLIVVGTLITAAGYVKGVVALRRSPLRVPNDESTSLCSLQVPKRGAAGSGSPPESCGESEVLADEAEGF
jgi:glucosyl-dolichyl phosphate glucuronosyltransferase